MGKKWIIIIVAVLLMASWQAYYLYSQAQAKPASLEEKAIEIAKKKKHLTKITNVEHFYKNEAYYVVEGKNQYGTDMIVWVGKDQSVFSEIANGGLSKKEIVQYVKQNYDVKEMIDSRLGLEDGIPLWEVVFIDSKDRYTYYYGYFENGKRYEVYRIKQDQ